MNTRIKQLMLQAGYAAPELAGRANQLAQLIVKDCAQYVANSNLAGIARENIPAGLVDYYATSRTGAAVGVKGD